MAQQAEIIALKELLHFYREAGVETPLRETPFDALAAPAQQPKTASSQPKSAPPQAAAPQTAPAAKPARPKPQETHKSFDAWLAEASAAARGAQNLAELKARIAAFDGCQLKFTAKNTCIADGSAPRELMLIGEGPGAQEDRQALPFVGPAGQMLTIMLRAIGFSRESLQSAENTAAASPPPLAYITNAVFWRPPGNRNPTAQEIALCRPFLLRQIELAQPKALISLGGIAAAALTGKPQPILRLRGRWQSFRCPNGAEIPLMPSLHPAFLLRSPAQKKAAWQDFLAVKMRLRGQE